MQTNLAKPSRFESPALEHSPSLNAWILQRIAASMMVKPGGPTDDFSKALTVRLWRSTVEEIGQERFDSALDLVLRESAWFPDIALIRKAAGVSRGIEDPLQREALQELRFVLSAMRLHGPELKPVPGKVIRDCDEHGLILQKPERAPETKPPAFSERTEMALIEFGAGSRAAGLELLACHPALRSEEASSFRIKTVETIEKRWINSYAGAR